MYEYIHAQDSDVDISFISFMYMHMYYVCVFVPVF